MFSTPAARGYQSLDEDDEEANCWGGEAGSGAPAGSGASTFVYARPAPLGAAGLALPSGAAAEEAKAEFQGSEEEDLSPPQAVHVVEAAGVRTHRVGSGAVAREVLARESAGGALVWLELTSTRAAAALIDAAEPGSALAGLQHPIARRVLLDPFLDAPLVETVHGWTLWSALLPEVRPRRAGSRRLRFVAASRDRTVVTLLRPSPQARCQRLRRHLSKRRRKNRRRAAFPFCWLASDSSSSRKNRHSRRKAARRAARHGHGHSHDSGGATSSGTSSSESSGGESADEEDVRRRRRRGAPWRREPPAQWLDALRFQAAERERGLAMGAAYATARLFESFLLANRALMDDVELAVSSLVALCDEPDYAAWRSANRVRFNRTSRMLFDAARMRTRLCRLHEYYDHALYLGRAAAASIKAADHHHRHDAATTTEAEAALWLRQLELMASGELRRLNHFEKLLHAYVMLARTRHEDDYNRISVLLSLVATIFLPLSFITGVFGMNLQALPLQHEDRAFDAFCALCGAIVFAFFALFWYHGWLNVFTPPHTGRRKTSRKDSEPLADLLSFAADQESPRADVAACFPCAARQHHDSTRLRGPAPEPGRQTAAAA